MASKEKDDAWSWSGLKEIAKLIDAEIEENHNGSQAEFARYCKIQGGTIGRLRKNTHNVEGRIMQPATISTIKAIAPYITDPATGRGFDPLQLLGIALGLRDTQKGKPMSKTWSLIEGILAVTKKSVDDFVAASGLTRDAMNEIMNGREANPKESPLVVRGINEIYKQSTWTQAEFDEVVFGVKPKKRNGSSLSV